MKNIIAFICALCLFSACTLQTSLEPGSYRSKLSVKLHGNNGNGAISAGGYLTIRIIGEDYDGISSIDLRIPAIGVDQEFVDYSNNEHWEINQTFNVDEIHPDEPKEIYIALTDNDGDVYSRTLRLKIDG